jgi:peroxiredoxin
MKLRFHRLVALTAASLVMGLALAGCTGSKGDRGSGDLRNPGPVPAGVSFREPPADAADAPAIELKTIEGVTAKVAELAEQRPVVLQFFSSWCEQCAAAQADFNGLAKRYKDKVVFIAVAGQDKEADVAEYVKKNNVPYMVAIDPDGKLWDRYAVREPPLIALVSKGGKLLRGWPGGIKADELDKQIKTLVIK